MAWGNLEVSEKKPVWKKKELNDDYRIISLRIKRTAFALPLREIFTQMIPLFYFKKR